MKFQCVCGKEFDNSRAFNGHKAHCKEHYLFKYGNLDLYQQRIQNVVNKNQITFANKKIEREGIKELQWIAEQHICEKCGRLMTKKFGSGRFCSRACSNSHLHSEESKEKCRNSMLLKFKDVKRQTHKKVYKSCTTFNNKLMHFRLYKDTLIKKIEITDDYLLNTYTEYIKNHNIDVINQYCRLFNIQLNKSVFIDDISYNRFQSSELYWLKIQNNLLVCEDINFNKLREYHNYFVKLIPGFPYYYASMDGHIYKLDMTEVKPFNSNGYYQVNVLNDNNEYKVTGVHRLIAATFISNFVNKPDIIVHHIDENKHNNNVNNLQVMTNSEHGKLHAAPQNLVNYIKTNGPVNKGKKMSNEFCEKCKQSAIKRHSNI